MTHESVLDEVSGVRSMLEALSWAATRQPPALFLEAVAQDEFTHDIVVRVTPHVFVVFDTT